MKLLKQYRGLEKSACRQVMYGLVCTSADTCQLDSGH